LAYPKLTGKAKLKNDLAQLEVKVQQAQDELNRTVNGVPLTPGTPAYIAADAKFKNAIADRNAAREALNNYVEPAKPVKPKSAKEIEAERQRTLKEGPAKSAEGTTEGITGGETNLITQTNAALAEKAKQENATKYIYKLSGPERLALAKQLKAANYNAPQTGQYNSGLVDAYISALGDAQIENTYNKNIEGYIPNTLESYLNYKTSLVNIGDQLPETTGVQQVYDKSTAEGVIDNLFQTFLKRDASQSEINSLYKQLDAEQKKASSISKTKYKMVNGVKVRVEEINFDPKVFLENKIKELPTYKESLAAKSEQNKLSLAATALANGYNLESDFGTQLPSWLDAINKGESISKFQSTIRKNARNALPEAVKNSIDPNEDLSTAFSTYISNYSKTFGVPASQVSLSKIIPMATNEKGFVPIYDFEKKKRQLAEWDYTQDARTETANVVSTVLKDFGFKG
jgi:hypothetical protein